MPVRKNAWDGKQSPTRPGGDDLPFVYSGTMVVQGRGVARVSAIGVNTEFGKIGQALQSVETDEPFQQKKSARMIQTFVLTRRTLGAATVLLLKTSAGETRAL